MDSFYRDCDINVPTFSVPGKLRRKRTIIFHVKMIRLNAYHHPTNTYDVTTADSVIFQCRNYLFPLRNPNLFEYQFHRRKADSRRGLRSKRLFLENEI